MLNSKTGVVWTMQEFANTIRERQLNHFDVNIGVSGSRGDGKSTFIFKLFRRFKKYPHELKTQIKEGEDVKTIWEKQKKGFNNKKHQVYGREDVIKLLSTQRFGFCWDDEAINSGFKRSWQDKGQQELIKIVTMYRDNFNIYASALPFFYSLDKALRELMFCHVHIIERGVGVILMPLNKSIHTQDPWDTVNNVKIEVKENARIKNNPRLRFGFHKFTTFAGYIYFTPLSKKQEDFYKKIKEERRATLTNEITEKKEKEVSYLDRLYGLLIEGKLTRDGLIQTCYMVGKKYNSVMDMLNKKLKVNGEIRTVGNLLISNNSQDSRQKEPEEENPRKRLKNLIPDV